jgi:hypothetical protein
VPNSRNIESLEKLFKCFSVPGVYCLERTQSVTHSFGASDGSDNFHCEFSTVVSCKPQTVPELTGGGKNSSDAWFHILCKNLKLASDREDHGDAANSPAGPRGAKLPDPNAEDYTWTRCGFFLRWNRRINRMDLLCFGASPSLQLRLSVLFQPGDGSVSPVPGDPYDLFLIILQEIYITHNALVRCLARDYQDAEKVCEPAQLGLGKTHVGGKEPLETSYEAATRY